MKGRHVDPALEYRLRTELKSEKPHALEDFLSQLSNAYFRTAVNILAERILAEQRGDKFWLMLQRLVDYNAKAFLISCLKTFASLYAQNQIGTDNEACSRFLSALSSDGRAIDRNKTLKFVLPLLKDPAEINNVLEATGVHQPKERITLLTPCATMPAAFVMFNSMRQIDHDKTFLTAACNNLMRRADRLAFNLTSLCRTYFDLSLPTARFSLQLKPYQLSRAETSYDLFRAMMNSI